MFFLLSCKSLVKLNTDDRTPASVEETTSDNNGATDEGKAAKLTSDNCTDPDLSKVASDQSFMLCNGTVASGTYTPDFPDVSNVLTTDTVNGFAGTHLSTAPKIYGLVTPLQKTVTT